MVCTRLSCIASGLGDVVGKAVRNFNQAFNVLVIGSCFLLAALAMM